MTGGELRALQVAIGLTVFAVFSHWYLKESLEWNHLLGFGFVAVGVFFVFYKFT